jgi:hypothetical protein
MTIYDKSNPDFTDPDCTDPETGCYLAFTGEVATPTSVRLTSSVKYPLAVTQP